MRVNWPDLVLGLVLVLFAVACAWNLIGAVRYRAILSQRKMLLFQRDDVGLREDPDPVLDSGCTQCDGRRGCRAPSWS